MKNTKRLIAAVLIVMIAVSAMIMPTVAADVSAGDLLRFVPVVITISEDETEIQGFFVNMNADVTIKDLHDISLTVYQEGTQLIYTEIEAIDDYEIAPMSCSYISISIPGNYDLNEGEYICGDDVYATFTAGFSTVTTESSSSSWSWSFGNN